MKEIMAYCGIICSECPAFLATQDGDHDKLKEIATQWSNEEMSFNSEDICCDGCLSNERVFSWCNDCDIRKCCRDKALENCAYCDDYYCDKLQKIFDLTPQARERLDAICNAR